MLIATIFFTPSTPEAQSSFLERGQFGTKISFDFKPENKPNPKSLGTTWNGSIYGLLDLELGYSRTNKSFVWSWKGNRAEQVWTDNNIDFVIAGVSIFPLKPKTITQQLQISLDFSYQTFNSESTASPNYALAWGISTYFTYDLGDKSFLQLSPSIGIYDPTSEGHKNVTYFSGEISLVTHLGKRTMMFITPSVFNSDDNTNFGISVGLTLTMNNKSKHHAIPYQDN